ncbi:MAG: DUF1343 domain-containing protein, partial [Fidelibacterota bacterium]
GLNLAVLTNQTAVNRNGVHLLDLLSSRREDFTVKVIFTPEFGLLENEYETVQILKEGKDPRFRSEVKNLWGRKFKPDINDLRGVDLVLVDLQDPGVRFISFMTTVTKVMEAAAEFHVPVMVLDRPNPLNGTVIDGPGVRPGYQSFSGYHLVPIRHGLTIGEYALMINETGWIRSGAAVELSVVPMINWKRDWLMDETGLPWVPPAPNMTDVTTLISYVGMGLLQGTNLSAGVGTDRPYLQCGAPWISPNTVLRSLRKKDLPGVEFSATTFVPDSLSGLVALPLYRGETCYGVRLHITNRRTFSPLLTVATLLSVVKGQYPHKFQWIGNNYVDTLYGHDYLRIFVAQGRDPSKLPATWTHDTIQFSQFRQKYLLY